MVVCRGVAQRLKLSVRGRRNALGSLVARRSCPWFSGTAAAFSIVFRCNTNTTPNFRVPLNSDTHEPYCRLADCFQGLTTKRLSLLAQRACTQMTGYFAGYISKRQPVGRYELRASCGNLARMMDTLPHQRHFSQYLRIVNRMFTDLETKGTLRTAPEVYNLAAHLNVRDPCDAEFVRTFESCVFAGGQLLYRYEWERKHCGRERTFVSLNAPAPRKGFATSVQCDSAEAYGHRGYDERVRYLSPWEFVMWWVVKPLLPPSAVSGAARFTAWCTGGKEYFDQHVNDDEPVALIPGVHYVVDEKSS